MRRYTMYVCGICSKESSNEEEIEMCEAKHMGLKHLKHKREYDCLKELVRSASATVSTTNNEVTRCAFDGAIKDLIDFELKHKIILSKQKN